MLYPRMDTLIKFAEESNAIEGVFDHAALERHVEAAASTVLAVSQLRTIPPILRTHRKLFYGSPMNPLDVGHPRAVAVRVGGNPCPPPGDVPALVDHWYAEIGEEAGRDWQRLDAAACWRYHHLFECIHPFVDGNGRVGRLVLNHLRLLAGLPWLVILAGARDEYYQAIQDFRSREWIEWAA